MRGRCRERLDGFSRRQAADHRELEQALGIRLGLSGQARDLRQTRADECYRESALHRPVQRGDERLELRKRQVLHLVEEKDHPFALVSGDLAQRDEQIAQVVGQVAAVREALNGVDVEAGGESPVGGRR